jgi:two-component system OmpR family response regulator
MRILLAEDDSVLADGLTRSLRQSGYAIDCVKNGQDADTALSTQEFDLLILDLGLPKLSGLDVLRRLRARGSLLPVLILTAADSIEQRVGGLDAGADDYMAKPFALSELEARVRALTRRGQGGGSTVIRHGPLAYDQVGRSAYINDQMLDLSARELGLLEILLARTGPPGVEGTAGRPPVRMGRGSVEQRHRGLRAPPAQEDRDRRHPHRHRARPGLLPGALFRQPAQAPAGRRRSQRRTSRSSGARPDRPADRRCPGSSSTSRPRPSPEESIQHSLFGEILDWMLAPLLLLWPMSIAITYLVAKSIANQPFDHALEDSVTVLAQQVKEVDGNVIARLPGSARDILRADDVDSVYFQISGPRGEIVDGDRDLPLPRRTTPSAAAACTSATRACTARRCASPMPGSTCSPCWTATQEPSRAWPWCRWRKRWKSAPSWPTRSSRA